MFKIIEGDFKNNEYSNEEYLDKSIVLKCIQILQNLKRTCIKKNLKQVYLECSQDMHGLGLVKMIRL